MSKTITAHPGTLVSSVKKLKPGDELVMESGIYKEDFKLTPPKGTKDNPIRIVGNPEALITGIVSLTEPTYVLIDGLRVSNPTTKHMVKIVGGDGWALTNFEFFDGKGLSTLLIQRGKGEGNFYVGYGALHDNTGKDETHDHLPYVSGRNGVMERLLLWNNRSGSMFKLGASDYDEPSAENIEVRYCTLYDSGESGLVLSGKATNNLIHHNIIVKTLKRGAIYGNSLAKETNVARDNIGWDTASNDVVSADSDGARIVDGGNNLYLDPQFDTVNALDGFHPMNPEAQFAGRWAV